MKNRIAIAFNSRYISWVQPLPGFRDFYPDALAVRSHLFHHWRETAERYGFREYDGPPLESLELYTQKSGEEIIGQLYNFADKGERLVALRPEMTPTLARMVGAHHRDYKKPIKWFAIPQLFRYERQQRGRLREHFQFNADILGESDVAADAELIALAIDTLRSLGLTEDDFVVRLSDRRAWQQLFTAQGIAEGQQYVAFQAIDKLEREPIEKTQEKLAALSLSPQAIVEILAFAESKTFDKTPDLLRAVGWLGDLAKYCAADFKIVRGLAYYTGIVWEIHDRKGEFRAIAGGGRYDQLVKQVSGVDLPALGFGMGDVVLGELLKARNLLPSTQARLDGYVLVADEILRPDALRLVHQLRDEGLRIDYPLTAAKMGKQFETAAAMGARFGVILGSVEWQTGEVTLKNLASGAQERVKAGVLAERIRRSE